MSVTLVLDDEIDVSRGDQLSGVQHPPHVGNRFQARSSGWTNGPPIPARVYVLKHTTRTVAAALNRPLALNQIGTVTVSATRAARIRSLREQPHNRQLHPDRPGDAGSRRAPA